MIGHAEKLLIDAELRGALAARAARAMIESKVPNNVLAATAMVVAADRLLMRALTLNPEIIDPARDVMRITLKMED